MGEYVKSNKELQEAKVIMYQEVIEKQHAVIVALKDIVKADKERIDHLTGLNVLLAATIEDLKHDLGQS